MNKLLEEGSSNAAIQLNRRDQQLNRRDQQLIDKGEKSASLVLARIGSVVVSKGRERDIIVRICSNGRIFEKGLGSW